jgi:ABC-type branched-subunit amino acid transport system permease subunit
VSGQRENLSLGKLALYSLGAATAVLVLTATLIAVLEPGPVVGLVIGLGGVAGAIAAMGVVSTRMTRRAFGATDGATETDPEAGAPS